MSLNDEQGSVLASVLLMLVVLVTLFVSVLSYAVSRYSVRIAEKNRLVAMHVAEAGMIRASRLISAPYRHAQIPVWTAPNGATAEVKLRPWGPLLLVESIGSFANQKVRRYGFLGSRPPPMFRAAVSVGDENTPLVVANNTTIIGDVNTGPLGITKGRYRGRGVDDGFLQGRNVIATSVTIPGIDTSLLAWYDDTVRSKRTNPDELLEGPLIVNVESDATVFSHRIVRVKNGIVINGASLESLSPGTILISESDMVISGTSHINGPIELIAEGSIIVSDSCVIDAALLVAQDSVILLGDVRFKGVVLAGKKVTIRDRVTMSYPSLAVVATKENVYSPGELSVNTSQSCEGSFYVVSQGGPNLLADRNLLYVDAVATLTGYAVSTRYAEIRGRIHGSIAAEAFYFEDPPTTYINWLNNTYADRSRLTYPGALPVLETKSSQPGLRILRTFEEL